MTNERDNDGREPLAEPEATAEERAAAEALRLVLEGEEPGAGAPEDLDQLAGAAALLRASGDLADTHGERLDQVRAELLSSPELSARAEGAARQSWWASVWERARSMGWPVWVPAGAMAVAFVGVALTSVPQLSVDSPAPRGMADRAPASPPEPPVVLETERRSVWDGLPKPPRELLATQARVAAKSDDGLEALRSPMADYRRRLYSVLTARCRRQADIGTAKPERMAAR